VASCLVALLASGCGSRLTTEEIRAQSAGVGSVANTPGETGGGSAAVADSTSATGDATGAAGTAGATATGSSKTVTGAAGHAATAAATAAKAPIVFGLIGEFSGIGGATDNPVRDAVVAWSKMVNARGGINGHPLHLLVADDGDNPARSIAIAKDFVESKGAIALSHMGSSTAFADYAKSKGVPVIGIAQTGTGWNSNPMLFPPYPGPEAIAWGAAHDMKLNGLTKAAGIGCAESPDCKTGVDKWAAYAQSEGVQVVTTMSYSIASPDYTAECIQMRNAGAQAVYPLGDVGSIVRLAQSCGRQGYHPVWVTPSSDDSMTHVADFENAIAVTTNFPWFVRSGSPAIQEYVDALKKYAPSLLGQSNAYVSGGWLSAKVFEVAAAHASDKPSSQDILEGLYAMRGETVGGLAPGRLALTFNRGQPTPPVYCVIPTRLVHSTWTAPQGVTPSCR
jgi:branched-chain amino acid transport system substrate-binding protein